MYTESEAAEKYCPVPYMSSFNGGRGHCVGSKCMAWRWKTPTKFNAIMKHREENNCSVADAKAYVDKYSPELTMEKTHGYCGLAGSCY